jgi:hypothetical protein
MDIFSEQAFNIIQDNINKYKTLIICDGGNKPLEIATYSQILESGDIIMPHDFGIEIDDHNIDKNIVEEYQPWSDRFISSGTTFKVFKKK